MLRGAPLDVAFAPPGPAATPKETRRSTGLWSARTGWSSLGPLRYLGGLRVAQRVLWCYLLWYLVVLLRYFDRSPTLWLSSLGISAIVGTALYLSTARAGRAPVKLERWQVVRLYLMPFCVSSFAALIKGRGFVLVFHPHLRDNLIGAGACAAFVAASALLRRSA